MTRFTGQLRYEYHYACRSCGAGNETRVRWIHWWTLDQRLVKQCPQCLGVNVEIVRVIDLHQQAVA